ncbi:hypothetical protein G3N55_11685 [Dissulfurirhabdus thermomarina]|uniref:BFD-like (2Fe-2S) protein n=1 Tax=Dissulfurirhabdus thermomarina TaxID=1765737 RepID=A0A6N9TYF0_DISTH|nr:hypothetical protein [Dissulfurirhabdus thermomarina]NDY43496.1 hypothetical protein [Dissulfurirhabdus thermomarina]NMX23808.1 hypothetical protein [Dissulfurirhabdus thermomarina]
MPETLCYCFGYTDADIRDDVRAHGRSTIFARILAEKAAGACRCAERNPRGR